MSSRGKQITIIPHYIKQTEQNKEILEENHLKWLWGWLEAALLLISEWMLMIAGIDHTASQDAEFLRNNKAFH